MKLSRSISSKQQSLSKDASWIDTFTAASTLYQKAINGDKQATQEAYRLLEQVSLKVPENTLVQAYYGSIICLIGRDLKDSTERFASVLRGLKLLDQAVLREPDNFEIRIIRGNVCLNLPEMYFHRNITAVEDCNFVIAGYEQYPETIPAEIYFQFLYNLSIAYRNLGKDELANTVVKKLCHESKNPKYKSLLAPKETPDLQQDTNSFFIMLQPLPIILETGEKLHQAALAGDERDIQKASDFFAKAQVFHPDNPLLKTYQADCMSLKAKFSTNTGEMFANAIKAMKTMDDEITSEPDNIHLRFIRANHSLRLPEVFFARTATAIADLEYLAERLKQNHHPFTKEQFEDILFNLGLCYFRLGLDSEGKQIWEDLSQACSDQINQKVATHSNNNIPPDVNPDLSLTTNQKEFYAEAKRLHDLGVAGNKAAALRGLEMWEKAYSEAQTDPVAEGFYGSSLALIGRDASDINTMFGNGIKGLKHLHQALDRAPDNWELRLLRAYLAYSLPEVFFHTTQQAIEDFQYLKNAYEQNNSLFTKDLYEQMIYDLQQATRQIE